MHAAVSASATRMPAALALRASPRIAGLPRALAKDEELFAEGDQADHFYKVLSGAVRTCKLLSDGRRQIDAFHFAGDIFGLEAGDAHRFCAEAVNAARVVAYRRPQLLALGEAAMAAVLANLERAQDHMLLLGRKTAPEKMASFLLGMAGRLPGLGGQFDLPMQRIDIADHLGLTIETVSRTLTQFARDGLIELPAASRSVRLCNKSALRLLNA